MNIITLNVCQGIGDILWVYKKFIDHFDEINFNVAIIGYDTLQMRSRYFLSLLPKVKKINFKLISPQYYDNLAVSKYHMKDVIANHNNKDIDYSCNKWLEDGTRLEDIDPEYSIKDYVDIRSDSCPLPYDKYVTLYVSGSYRSPDVWKVSYWVDLILSLYEKYGINYPIILIGASYDKLFTSEVKSKLDTLGIKSTMYIDSYISNVCYIIKNSVLFIGYQSGLNTVAENFDVKQIMIYFPKLCDMATTWVKKSNINSCFNYGFFNEIPSNIIGKLPEGFLV